ncbi:hypothetical protein [Minwuia sp. IMCC4030]|nr:hypothetical protein [Minwuia sp. IMCC4030]
MNAYFASAEYEHCVEAADKAIQMRPNFYGAHYISGAALALLGRIEEAGDRVRTACELNPRLTVANTARNPMFVRADDVSRLLKGLELAGTPA